jgi:hypothetical protein
VLRLWVAQVFSFVDLVIAHDGAWELMPGAKPRSPYRQRQALRDACVEHGLDLYLRANKGQLWSSEVAKRAAELGFASDLLTSKDWLLRLDADEFVFGRPKELRRYLRSAWRDVATVRFHQAGTRSHSLPRLIRVLPGLTVKEFHHFVHAEGKDLVGSRRNVSWGSCPRDALQILHHPDRSPERLVAKLDYYQRRDELQVEG